MSALVIVIISKIKTVKSASNRGIFRIWIVVSLHISAENILAVALVVEILLVKNHARAIILRNPVLGRKEIQLFSRFHNQHFHHQPR